MEYRREIDGLRALAVTTVLLFHFWPRYFPNGFLGVDIFFVISGFLMTLYILEEYNRKKFKLKTFYLRRILRILPLTLSVLSIILLFSIFILISKDLSNLYKSLIAALTFSSNFYFWRTGGYFGSPDALKPLLHIWSLSVEEQFYFFFPITLLIIMYASDKIKTRITLMFFLALASFTANLKLIASGGHNPAFFLTPFRIWQFAFGAIGSFVYSNYNQQHSKITIITSITLIVLGLTKFYNLITPGFVVTLGTTLFLSLRYTKVPIVCLYFSSEYIRKIGLLSFSIYLWHWPIIVFLNYITIDNPSSVQMTLCFALTFILSWISYTYIEQPFRNKIKPSLTVITCLTVTLFLALTTVTLLHFGIPRKKNSFAENLAASVQDTYRCDTTLRSFGGSRACLLNDKSTNPYKLAFLGNSHALMYGPALEKILTSNMQKGLMVTLTGCLPTIDINVEKNCFELAKANLKAILSDNQITTVVIAMSWYQDNLVLKDGSIAMDKSKKLLLNSTLNLINTLEKAGKSTYLVSPIRIPHYNLPSVLSRKSKFEEISDSELSKALRVKREVFDSEFKETLTVLEKALEKKLINTSLNLCDKEYCYYGDESGSYFSDHHHLSKYGVTKVISQFDRIEIK